MTASRPRPAVCRGLRYGLPVWFLLVVLHGGACHAQTVTCRLERIGKDLRYICEGADDNGGDRSDGNHSSPSPAIPGLPIEPVDAHTSVPLYENETGPFPELEYLGAPPHGSRLQNCQGDCNNDQQCDFGLVCFKRNGDKRVPGCAGTGISMLDYCYRPPPGTLVIVGNLEEGYLNYPLERCQGRCKSDDDCAGNLRCWKRDLYEPVPGCEGFGAREREYCYDPEDLPSAPPSATPIGSPSKAPSGSPVAAPSATPSRQSNFEGAGGASGYPSLSPEQSIRPSTSPGLGMLSCLDSKIQLERCFDSKLDETAIQTCDHCVMDLIPPPMTTCSDLESIACGAIAFCDCGPCADELEAYLACGFEQTRGCTIDCDFSPSQAPSGNGNSLVSPTIAPSAVPSVAPTGPPSLGPMTCGNAQAYIHQCFETEMDAPTAAQCDKCIVSAMPGRDVQCGDVEGLVCAAIKSCPCEPCEDAIENYLSCGLKTDRDCAIDCNALSVAPSASPSNPPSFFPTATPSQLPSIQPSQRISLGPMSCNNAQEYVDACFKTYYTQDGANHCDRCIAGALPPAKTNCSETESISCKAIVSCPCDFCVRELENLFNCRHQKDDGCTIDCGFSFTPTNETLNELPTVSPSSAPSIQPSQAAAMSDAPSRVPSSQPSLLPSTVQSPNPSGTPSQLPSKISSLSPSQAPTSPKMTEENAGAFLEQCFQTHYNETLASECNKCILAAVPLSNATCGALESTVCSSIAKCSCTRCSDVIENYLSVGFQAATGCAFDCNRRSTAPSHQPSGVQTASPSLLLQSDTPSIVPSESPSAMPSDVPSLQPSSVPSDIPSLQPSSIPSDMPSLLPSSMPSDTPSLFPSSLPSDAPSLLPSSTPSDEPSSTPSRSPSSSPSSAPSDFPSMSPSVQPSESPSMAPSTLPSDVPSAVPSDAPSVVPSSKPSSAPSDTPSLVPSSTPSSSPSWRPANESFGGDCGMTSDERSAAIASSLASVLLPETQNSTSAAEAASTWILEVDGRQLCPSYPKLSQRFIVAMLYFSTSGEDWASCPTNSNSSECEGDAFLGDSDECSWQGITCNKDGYVTGIHMDNRNLSGSIPNELSGLVYLEEIHMGANNLTGTIPASLGTLESLQYVDLDKNRLTGRLPEELFNATTLRVLDLDTNRLEGTISSAIAALSDLYFVQLDFNQLTGSVPSELGSLASLQYMGMFGNAFTSSLPVGLCGREIQLYANCSICPKPAEAKDCCTACLKG